MKISKCEIQFLHDHRYARKMVVANIDRNGSRMWVQAVARDEMMEVAGKIEKLQAEVWQEQVQFVIFVTKVLTR